MQLNEIKSDSNKRKTRVGRGGKRGTTSGKGSGIWRLASNCMAWGNSSLGIGGK